LAVRRFSFITKTPGERNREPIFLDSSNSRVNQVVFAEGKLWGALNTALDFGHGTQAGIAYFVIRPVISSGSVGGSVVKQGYLGVAGNNLTYAAVGVTAAGRGVIAFTLVGPDHYPSAAYATLDAITGTGDIHIVAEGLGPQDGIFEYRLFDPPSAHGVGRWGDYAATVVDGNSRVDCFRIYRSNVSVHRIYRNGFCLWRDTGWWS
jgi:hypothetical protein